MGLKNLTYAAKEGEESNAHALQYAGSWLLAGSPKRNGFCPRWWWWWWGTKRLYTMGPWARFIITITTTFKHHGGSEKESPDLAFSHTTGSFFVHRGPRLNYPTATHDHAFTVIKRKCGLLRSPSSNWCSRVLLNKKFCDFSLGAPRKRVSLRF